MCQMCVSEGRMTQEEMDQAILAGDMSVLPMFDLPREKAIEMIAEMCMGLMGRGELSLLEATAIMAAMVDGYDDYRAENPS